MPTTRETVLAALHARLQPLAARTLRDEVLPERIPAAGLIILRDGQPGEPEVPGLTVEAFEAAGARFYNDAILVTAVGSLPIRVGRQFTAARKLGRTHQNVLVFCKGDPRKATEACGPVEFGEIDAAETADEADPEDDK
ncbi:MAG: hypothetical protein LPK12_06965 [Rhodobacterales bacterium]|nr:hypothetical protein [Rhodobacterales bacterium]MDX5499728.1 hypothetical protein [Rhodobacterales bacterium]